MSRLDGPQGVGGARPQQEVRLYDGNAQRVETGSGNVPMTSGGGQSQSLMGFSKSEDVLKAQFETSGFKVTKEDVKNAGKQLNTHNTGFLRFNKTQQIADITNDFSFQIYQLIASTDDQELYNLGAQFIKSMPRAAKNGQLAEHKNACQQHYNDFIMTAQNKGLMDGLVAVDQNAEDRHQAGEVAADLRAAHSDQVTVQTGNRVIGAVNEHTDASNAAQTAQINANTNRVGNRVIRNVNAHTDQVGQNVIDANIQNNMAMLGMGDGEINPETGESERTLTDGRKIGHGSSVIGRLENHMDQVGAQVTSDVNAHTTSEVNHGVQEVNAHTTAEQQKTRMDQQRQAVLDAKRQNISDMLMHEDSAEWGGSYRDSTVKWLGSAADRVMGDTKLTFEQKKEALDELVRMVDEENVISDGDKNAFESRYFWDHEQHPQV